MPRPAGRRRRASVESPASSDHAPSRYANPGASPATASDPRPIHPLVGYAGGGRREHSLDGREAGRDRVELVEPRKGGHDRYHDGDICPGASQTSGEAQRKRTAGRRRRCGGWARTTRSGDSCGGERRAWVAGDHRAAAHLAVPVASWVWRAAQRAGPLSRELFPAASAVGGRQPVGAVAPRADRIRRGGPGVLHQAWAIAPPSM